MKTRFKEHEEAGDVCINETKDGNGKHGEDIWSRLCFAHTHVGEEQRKVKGTKKKLIKIQIQRKRKTKDTTEKEEEQEEEKKQKKYKTQNKIENKKREVIHPHADTMWITNAAIIISSGRCLALWSRPASRKYLPRDATKPWGRERDEPRPNKNSMLTWNKRGERG